MYQQRWHEWGEIRGTGRNVLQVPEAERFRHPIPEPRAIRGRTSEPDAGDFERATGGLLDLDAIDVGVLAQVDSRRLEQLIELVRALSAVVGGQGEIGLDPQDARDCAVSQLDVRARR